MRTTRWNVIVPIGLAAALIVAVGTACTSPGPAGGKGDPLPRGGEAVRLDPADFTVDISNRYWPMKPGDRWIYEEKDGDGAVTRDEVTVLERTERINGVEARVVHDVATVNGTVVEDTIDWYAQDSVGNVWYLGERTTAYEHGKPTSTSGSWVAGEDGAQPGVLLPARPRAGMQYRQEYRKGEAEDGALVLSIDERAQTAAGSYEHALMTRETTPLEPDLVELKWYVPDVGPVLTLTPSGENTREQLIRAPA